MPLTFCLFAAPPTWAAGLFPAEEFNVLNGQKLIYDIADLSHLILRLLHSVITNRSRCLKNIRHKLSAESIRNGRRGQSAHRPSSERSRMVNEAQKSRTSATESLAPPLLFGRTLMLGVTFRRRLPAPKAVGVSHRRNRSLFLVILMRRAAYT